MACLRFFRRPRGGGSCQAALPRTSSPIAIQRPVLGKAVAIQRSSEASRALVARRSFSYFSIRSTNGSLLDPGRQELEHEYLGFGQELLALRLTAGGGKLKVYRHDASEYLAPAGSPPGSHQEWRSLRFEPDEGSTNLIQAATKVSVEPVGDGQLSLRQQPDVLTLAYTKAFVSVVLGMLAALGAPVARLGRVGAGDHSSTGRREEQTLRFLCIGLGAGTVPSFLAHAIPCCHVDVVELEPAVVRAASEAMGFTSGPRVCVSIEDGAEFAMRSATSPSSRAQAYDAVLVDAYDSAGNVPLHLQSRDGKLARALARGLLNSRHGLIATNFLPSMPASEAVVAYRDALAKHTCDLEDGSTGPGFTVEAEGTGNLIAVQTCGRLLRPDALLKIQLQEAAAEVSKATGCNFDMTRFASRRLQQY
eukprot:gnl/TRDRNA2_/TRDRNA2_201743_c0_seq1.p1 gnl/TRDRNA2_/TRDRNA2_201743_c0~~gnl/TRDRNA2_/TRDRNA2_201743_c0_seq1.p1  ORF type:complete len:420 (+),score=59.19 gnl/TRDRNA2_/TRDRNA2_201743_c0_seq1:182-1441(+)